MNTGHSNPFTTFSLRFGTGWSDGVFVERPPFMRSGPKISKEEIPRARENRKDKKWRQFHMELKPFHFHRTLLNVTVLGVFPTFQPWIQSLSRADPFFQLTISKMYYLSFTRIILQYFLTAELVLSLFFLKLHHQLKKVANIGPSIMKACVMSVRKGAKQGKCLRIERKLGQEK